MNETQEELDRLWEEAAPPDEPQFQDWYGKWSSIAGLDPDPDHPEHHYDYRSAFRAGVEPEQSEDGLYHWPSQYKADDHPNRYVGNLDTKTGENLDELWDQAAPLQQEQQDIPVEAGAAAMDFPTVEDPMSTGHSEAIDEVAKIFQVIKGLGIEGAQGIGDLAMAAAGFSKQAQRNLARADFGEELERQYQRRVEQAKKNGMPIPPREDLDDQKAQLREYSTNAQKSWLEAAEGLQAFTGSLPESEDVYGDDRPVAQYIEQAVKGFARFLPAMGVTALVPTAGLPLTYAQIFGASYREKVKQGIDDQVAFDAAALEAAISTPLEFGGNILQLRLFKGAWNTFVKTSRLPQKVAAVLKSIVFGGLGEGIEEYLQQYPEELANIYAKHPDATAEEIVEMARKVYLSEEFQAKAGKAGLMGATGGAILGAVGAGAGMMRPRGDIVQEQVDQVKRAIDAGMMSPADLKTMVESLEDGPLREGLEAISAGGKAAGEQAQFAPAAEEDLQHLTTYLQEHLGEGTEIKVTAMDASEAAASVQRVGQAFGRKVIFFDAEGAANGFNGLYDQASDTIFVNSRAENPYITVVGHETLHALKTKAPDLYEQLSDIVVMSEGSQTWLDALNEGRKAVGLEALKLEDALAQEEHLADFVGQQFRNEDFWRQLNEKNPTVAKSLAETVFKLLEKIRQFLTGFKAPADPELVKNLEETQAALVAVFSEFSTRETKVQDQTAVPVQPAKEKGILQKGLEAVGEAIGPSAAEAKMVTKATKAKARTTEITEEMWDQAERIEAEVQPTETQPEPTEEAPKAEAAKTPREEFDELWQTLDPEQKRRLADVPGDDEIDYPSKIQMVRAELATKRPERPKVKRKDIAASVTTGERVTTLRGRIRAMGGINFLNFKGELKDMPSVKIALSRKGGEKIDLAEEILREEGWLAPDEKLLDVLRIPGAMRRGRVMREGEREKLPGYQTDQERRLQAEMGWEAEAPPEGDYVQMRAQDLPEGKQLVILDGKSARGWDVYQVVEKDAFGVTLRDGETVNLGPNDLVEVVEPGKAAELKTGGPGITDLRSKDILASTRRGPGHVAISNQAAWIAENRNRMLPEIEVEVSAIDETGKSYKIKDKADIALKELDRQKSFAERLLECLKS